MQRTPRRRCLAEALHQSVSRLGSILRNGRSRCDRRYRNHCNCGQLGRTNDSSREKRSAPLPSVPFAEYQSGTRRYRCDNSRAFQKLPNLSEVVLWGSKNGIVQCTDALLSRNWNGCARKANLSGEQARHRTVTKTLDLHHRRTAQDLKRD